MGVGNGSIAKVRRASNRSPKVRIRRESGRGLGDGVEGQIAILEVRPQPEEAHVLEHLPHLICGATEGATALTGADVAEHRDQRTDELRPEVLAIAEVDDELATRLIKEAARVVRRGGMIVVWEDIPSPWWNLLGHVIHRLDLGSHIRTPAGYRGLLERHLAIQDSADMRSGAMDYQVFVATPLPRA